MAKRETSEGPGNGCGDWQGSSIWFGLRVAKIFFGGRVGWHGWRVESGKNNFTWGSIN